ncbi:zinc-binding oxidoreductase [Colletotrichum higginsianum]|uniref:Zinc-binding oxidoreductase n=2 Tax=Colletotrichum higginsianum TaxID=80884 RepID=H1VP95_COLHI|nr:Zinc-binding oxidoreductase [Colletotrichum higginsianum IMI 349063]OBR14505.1 Zinc-binding oxidoreductase [Colletotrichum higginsianum IMI 349063]TID01595.1 Zinc-type alcohol dehydrogenase-like protein C16A3.02c [Colletotrichum higginsianum]GJC94831.1 zinc-binding oxidoreductase [Colletotrichum higginsianum]CCF42049.1 zinc-binding oxidoreductase [Colletotrichum higginsianum]
MRETMRSWQYSAVDGRLEDCLTLKEDTPAPQKSSLGKDELIVEVISASLNPVDYKIPVSTLLGRLMITRPATPGLDFCGRVVATHPSNDAFKAGQIVFGGYPGPSQRGTLAEYIIISGANCTPVPEGVDPDQASAVGTAATTAYQSLMPDTLKAGGKIFINGGSGGTGTWTIQMAKALGVEVVTTCSGKNIDLCRQLGADEVIDYRTRDVVAELKSRGKVFDLVIDNVGGTSALYDISSTILKPGGTFSSVGVGEALSLSGIFSDVCKLLRPSFLGGKPFYFVQMDNTAETFRRIGDWMAQGKARAVIDSSFAFEDVPAAYSKLREGHAKGKIVVHVAGASRQ